MDEAGSGFEVYQSCRCPCRFTVPRDSDLSKTTASTRPAALPVVQVDAKVSTDVIHETPNEQIARVRENTDAGEEFMTISVTVTVDGDDRVSSAAHLVDVSQVCDGAAGWASMNQTSPLNVVDAAMPQCMTQAHALLA